MSASQHDVFTDSKNAVDILGFFEKINCIFFSLCTEMRQSPVIQNFTLIISPRSAEINNIDMIAEFLHCNQTKVVASF